MKRREDEPLITGRGRFVDDIRLKDPLHVAFARSTVAHGRLLNVDVSSALEIDGILAAYAGPDVAELGGLLVNNVVATLKVPPYPILATDHVRAVGQPVAALVARSSNAAMEACEAIVIDVEEAAALSNLADAEEGPALFPDIPDNIAVRDEWTLGDVDAAFARAAHIVSVDVAHPRLAPTSLEPRAIAVDYDGAADRLTVWLSTQTPHRARSDLARILKIDETRLRVIAPDVGGAFGMKASLYPEEIFVVWAALRLKRSVRWTATRSEEFLSASHGRGGRNRGTLALASDGRFLALRAEMVCPLGHWLPNSAAIPAWNAGRILPGPYAIEAVNVSTRGVLTHTAPVGIYRGAGRPEAALLMERLVEEAARALDLCPADIRQRNLIPAEQMPFTGPSGICLDSGNYREALQIFCDFADYSALKQEVLSRRKSGELVGLGLAFYVEPCGKGWESARVEMRADGTVLAATGSSTQGHGRQTAYAQIVADVFGIDPSNVEVAAGDTAICPAGIGALASRSTAIGGSALLVAARKVKAEWDRTGTPAVAEIVYENDGEAWGYGCHLAIVSIDRETGALNVERILCLDDIGTVINPMLADGQVMGGIAQGVGEALLESIVYDADGQLLTGSLSDYALPRAEDMPDIRLSALATPSPNNLLGAKGVGEAGTIGAPAAILNAALDALSRLGVHDLSMPLTSETLWRAIQDAAQSKQAER